MEWRGEGRGKLCLGEGEMRGLCGLGHLGGLGAPRFRFERRRASGESSVAGYFEVGGNHLMTSQIAVECSV